MAATSSSSSGTLRTCSSAASGLMEPCEPNGPVWTRSQGLGGGRGGMRDESTGFGTAAAVDAFV
jgi:hypothetical protein